MKIICANCRQVLQGTEKSLGHRARCPKCNTVFRITVEHCPDLTKEKSDNLLNHQTTKVLGTPALTSTPTTDRMPEEIADAEIKRQTRWAITISAVGLTCVATFLITVFTMRNSPPDKLETAQTKKSIINKTSTSHQKTLEKGTGPLSATDTNSSLMSENTAKIKNSKLSQKTSEASPTKINSQPELSTTDLIEKVDRSICKIESGLSSGTGFLVAPGIVATNAHVVNSWNELNCYFPGNYNASEAQILWFNPDIDIAFLSVTIDRPPLKITNSDDTKRGEKVIAIGYPGTIGTSVSSSITTGVLSNRTSIAGIFYYQTDAPLNSGNSGGPVFDRFGKVIGIATLKEIDKENIGYVLPVSYVFSEYADMHKSPPQERLSKLARYTRDSDIEAIKGGNALVILMLADIESAWSNAINYEYDFQKAVQIVSEKHSRFAEFTLARMNKIDTNLTLYKQTLTERQVRAIIVAKNIVIEACNFVKSPSGNYLRFEQYWPAKISQIQEETLILKSITD